MKTLLIFILFFTVSAFSSNKTALLFARENIYIASDPIYIAIVIDDFGNQYDDIEKMVNIGIPITGAIIPGSPNSIEQMHLLKEKGHGIMIHMPIESRGAKKSWDTGLALKGGHSKEQIIANLEKAIEELPLATSINNHMGSIGTANRELMEIYVAKAKQYDFIVLDSLTTTKSKVKEAAEEQNAIFFERDVFLDNKKGIDHVQKSLLEALEIGKKNGYAIAIGHVGPAGNNGTTVQGIKDMIGHLQSEGVVFVTIDELHEIFGGD
ncbi:MAG: divergent polysaccharide deacetylase family protein [Defluviitaleaceae bacterium]|nr:divergent polysaccharide deacetylase family protein [Defluviitaleaceae bacterium]